MSILVLGSRRGYPRYHLVSTMSEKGSSCRTHSSLGQFGEVRRRQRMDMRINSPSSSLYPRCPLRGKSYNWSQHRLNQSCNVLTHIGPRDTLLLPSTQRYGVAELGFKRVAAQ